MAYTNFNTALMQAKRASTLRGVPFSTQDFENLHGSYMEGAGERVAAERSGDLANRSLSAQEKNWSDTLVQEKELDTLRRNQNTDLSRMQIDAQDKAASKALAGNVAGTATSLGGAYLISGKGAGGTATGTGAGAGGGAAAGGSASPAVTSGAGYNAGILAALIYGGLKTKQNAQKYAREGDEEKGGVTGYAAEASQHPVAAVADPNQMLVDTGVIKEDSDLGKYASKGAIIEEKVVSKLCGIIMSAIHGADSYEVNLCREYRESFLTDQELRGYYIFAEPVCFIMEKHPKLKRCFRKHLTEKFVDYSEYKLGKKAAKPRIVSIITSRLFIKLCRYLGGKVRVYKRINGEVF